MTLIELLAASAILVIVIAAVGYVYTQTSQAVGVTGARIEINATIRSVTRQLSEDLRTFTPDGILIMAESGPPIVAGEKPPAMLMFTATGRFESRTRLDAFGRPVTANAALIVYVPARSAIDAEAGDILCRYVFLLTGDGQWPVTLRELAGAACAGDINWLDGCDCLGDSLFDLRHRSIRYDPGSLEVEYLAPVVDRVESVNPAPMSNDDPVAGGIVQLWPYLAGGCRGLTIEFCDGLAEDGSTPQPRPMAWFTPGSTGAFRRRDPGGNPRRLRHLGVAWLCWNRSLRQQLPNALRVRFELQDVAGRVSAGSCEIAVPIRR